MPDPTAPAAPVLDGSAVAMPSDLNTLNMSMLATFGALLQNNVATMHKVLDNDYIENHRQVSIVQALGDREVMSKVTPGGPQPANVK